MLRPVAALMMLALPATAASAQAKPCFSTAEATSLVTALLPDGLAVAVEKCRAVLPAQAYLVRSGDALVSRYRAQAAPAFKGARPVFAKMMGKDAALLDSLDDETVRKLMGAGVAQAIGKDIKPATCPDIDRIAEALDPLPPRNMSLLVGAILDIVSREDKSMQKGALPICAPAALAGK
jgi:hypothetical protein